jgi:hypothetical protein
MSSTDKETTIRTGAGAIFSFSTTIVFAFVFSMIDNSDLQGKSLLSLLFLLSFVCLFAYLGVLSDSIVVVRRFKMYL